MKIFVTGATGFVGSATVDELIRAGHTVLGLARSDAGAASLTAAGAEAHRGDLDDLESLRSGAIACDGVIHTGFKHDFANIAAACETDSKAIETLGTAVADSGRPLVVTSGVAGIVHGRSATEDDPSVFNPAWPRASEQAATSLAERGVRASMVRLSPTVHGSGDHGFVPMLINLAREKGVSAYVGDGLNRWPAVHRLDSAVLFRLAIEKASAGERIHGVAEEGVPFKEIAQAIARGLNVPLVSKSTEEAAEHFGWMALFAALDCPASNAQTQQHFGWHPTQPGLIRDLNNGSYFPA